MERTEITGYLVSTKVTRASKYPYAICVACDEDAEPAAPEYSPAPGER